MKTFSSNLSAWKRTGGAGSLALGFTSDIITLFAHDRESGWAEVGSAAIADPTFAEQIEALRVEAMVRDKTKAPVTIWLPADQVIERHYTLAATGPDLRSAEAARRIADETPHGANELSVAIASDSRHEPVKVLAVLLQTMNEARAYAESWGFTPGVISTHYSAMGFAPPGPIFEYPRSVAKRAGRTFTRMLVAASALALVGGAAFGAYHLVRPLLDAPVEVNSAGPAPSSFAVFVDPPPGPQFPMRVVEKTPVSSLAMQSLAADTEGFEPGAGTSIYTHVPAVDTPRGLSAPDGSDPLKVGRAPDKPRFALMSAPAPSAEGGLPVLASIDPVAPEPEPDRTAAATRTVADENVPVPGREETDTADATVEITTEAEISTSEFAPETVAFVPLRRPGSEPAEADTNTAGLNLPKPRPESLVKLAPTPTAPVRERPAVASTVPTDDTATAETPTPDASTTAATTPDATTTDDGATDTAAVAPETTPEATTTGDTATEDTTATETAAVTPTAIPTPRATSIATPDPASTPAPDGDTEVAALPNVRLPVARAPSIGPSTVPTTATESRAPEVTPEATTTATTNVAAPANRDLTTPTPTDEASSDLAAIQAPTPSKRPRALEFAARRMPARTRTPLAVYLPRSVSDAARRTGLSLDKTNLIGVIEANSGRQALIRLPNGGFRKVGQGDKVNGWRVSSVNRESVRLTRKGEKRTLLLVTP